MELKYFLELDPCPSNNAYATFAYRKGKGARSHRFLQDYHRYWKEAVKELMNLIDGGVKPDVDEDAKLVMKFYLFWAWDDYYTTNGYMQPKDASNHTKLLEDAIAEYIGLDDKHNIEVYSRKYPSTYNHILVVIQDELTHPIDGSFNIGKIF